MVELEFHFDIGTDKRSLVTALRDLPIEIRPVYFSPDEDSIEKSNTLDDAERFESFLNRNEIGFFLYSENGVSFDISDNGGEYPSVSIYPAKDISNETCLVAVRRLCCEKPIFGWACDEDEFEHRNRQFITIGADHVESWLGRDLNKFVPGVYWLTVISDYFLARHSMNLKDLTPEVLAMEEFGDGTVHLMKFFDDPKNWQEHSDRLDDLCSGVDGLFSRKAVDEAVKGVTSYLEYEELMSEFE